MPPAAKGPSWSKESCRRIGKVLLDAPDRTLTAKEITARGGGSNAGRDAGKMVGTLLEERPPPPGPKVQGRPVEKSFHLPDEQVEPLKAALAAIAPPAGQLAATQQLVFADAGKLSALMEALDVSTLLSNAAWFTVCDGQPQEYVIAFAGDDAVSNAQTLAAELQASGLTAHRSSVTQIGDVNALAEQARTAAIASRKARMRGTG
jgi:hypothetical protein